MDIVNLKIHPNMNGATYIFAGTDGAGVFLYIDNGGSWNPINSGALSFSD